MSMIQKLSFGFLGGRSEETGILEDILPFPIALDHFVRNDVQAIYSKILTDTLERTEGIPEKNKKLLWDNCLGSESSDGLVTMLAKAMASKGELYLVLDGEVLRKATAAEQATIKADYEKNAESSTGIYITFKNFTVNDMVKLYSQIEFFTIGGLYKSAGISRAIQLKMKNLRASVALADAGKAEDQARSIAKALKAGKDVMIDGEDTIETAKPDLSATTTAIDFINAKRAFYLRLPPTYFGEAASKGLGDSGIGDNKKVEAGLRNYFFSIVKPTCDALFDVITSFKTDDFDSIDMANQTLQTFDSTSDDHLSKENKTIIINKLYGLPEDETGDEPEATPPPVVNQPQLPPGNVPAPAPKA